MTCRVNGLMMDFSPQNTFSQKKLQVDTQQSFVQKYGLFVHFVNKGKQVVPVKFSLLL